MFQKGFVRFERPENHGPQGNSNDGESGEIQVFISFIARVDCAIRESFPRAGDYSKAGDDDAGCGMAGGRSVQ